MAARTTGPGLASGHSPGARLVVGGPGAPADASLQAGHYMCPTLFAEIDNAMRIAQEEIFGPAIGMAGLTGFTEHKSVAV